MTIAATPWLQAYLRKLSEHPQFVAARTVGPLWLLREGAEHADRTDLTPSATRVTIQMAAELFPRMALSGPAGAGKTTLLQQLAIGLAEQLVAGDRQKSSRGDAITPLPLFIDLSRFERSIEATLAATFELELPSLAEAAQERPLLFLLDGLDELTPGLQLAGLATIAATIGALGTQARWIATCCSEHLALFRPWLGGCETRGIRPLLQRDVLGALQQHSAALAAWLQRSDDLVALATRPRWLASLIELQQTAPLQPPYSRGRALAEWLPAVIAATLHAHPRPIDPAAAMRALAILAADMTQRQSELIAHSAAIELLAGPARAADPPATLQLLQDSGILAIEAERHDLSFCHPTLRSFAQALDLVGTPPDQWPSAIFSRAWSNTIVLSYSLCDRPEQVLRRLLDSDAVALTARCLIDAEPPDQFEHLLNRSGTLTPPLRIMLADAFAAEGLTSVALDQLERAGAEGYDEAGLFGRLGELYSSTGQWRHARVAYEQALLRESGDLRYRHRLGVICGRLGEHDQAAAALQAVVRVQQERLAEAAYELGNVYLAQGRAAQALDSYRQAAGAQPGLPAYRLSLAGALRQQGHIEDAEALLRQLIDEDSSDAPAFAELGQVCADVGRTNEAIRYYLKAVELRPTEAGYYVRIGQLRRARGDLSGARAALQRAAELDSTDAPLYFALGETYQQSGELEAALAAYRHAVRLDPHNEDYHRWLGALLADQGEYEEAAQALRTALELRPDSAETHARLAALFWRQERAEQALDSYRRALALDPACADYEHDLGMVYYALGKPRAAAPHLHRAVDLDPARADLHYDAGRVAEALRQWDSVAAAYERATMLAPEQPIYARAAGALQLRLGHHQRARTLLAGALRRDRHDPATLYLVGMLHAATARVPHAIRALGRAASTGRSAEYYDQFGRMLASAARFGEACAAFKQALLIDADNADTLFCYSRTLVALGRTEEAFIAAKQAAALSSGNAPIQHHAGTLALQLGRPHDALALLDRAVTIDSSLAPAQLDRARVLLQLRQPQAALAAALAALAIAPDLAPAALIAGQAALQLGQNDVACKLLDRAIGLDDQLAPAHAARRDLLAAIGDRDGALESARRAVALDRNDAGHLLRLGELLLAIGSADAAATALEHALRCDARLAEAHACLSRIHARAGAWDRARYHAECAIGLEPARVELQALLADALIGLGDDQAAGAALADAIAYDPSRADWHAALGQMHMRAGDITRALACLRQAVRIAPDHAEYHHMLGQCLGQTAEHAQAVEAIEQARRLCPTQAEWRADLAQLQIARGWNDEALLELNQAIDVAPTIGRLWRLRAELQLRLKQPDAARADLIEALRRDPHDARSFVMLASLLIERGRLQDALEAAQRAVALQPAEAEPQRMLARVLRALERHAEAAEVLQQLLTAASPGAEWAELAGDYEASSRIDRARAAWEQALAGTPDDAALRYGYGCHLARAADIPGALAQLRRALAIQPDFAAAHARVAEIALDVDQPTGADQPIEEHARAVHSAPAPNGDQQPISIDEGIQSARRAVDLHPDQSAYWQLLGATLQRKRADPEAFQALRKARDLAPGDPRPAFALGQSALAQGALDDAVAAFQAAAAADPENATYHGHLGVAIRRPIALPYEPDELGVPPPDARARLEQSRAELEHATRIAPTCARWHYELGLALQLLGQHDQAIAAFSRAHELAEGQPGATSDGEFIPSQLLVRRGLSQLLAGRAAEARLDLETARSSAPEDWATAYLLGRIAYTTGDYPTAQSLLVRVVADDPAHFQAQLYLGQTWLALNRPAEALAALERATELRPGVAAAQAQLSDAYLATGRHERALVAAVRALRLDSSVAEHHQRLAGLYALVGRLKEARSALLNALTLRPDAAGWHAQMSEICARLGMHDAARGALARASQLAPNEHAYRYAMAQLLAGQGRTAEAVAALEAALQHAPDHGAWHHELGQLHEQLGNHDTALEYYTSAIQYAPEIAEHWQALARVQQRRCAPEIAQETLERALEHFGEHPALHLAIGTLFAGQDLHDAAAWHFGIAVEQDPQHAEHWWRLGCAQIEIGNPADARAALEKALSLDSRAAEAHAALARLLVEAGDSRGALVHSQRAIELQPNDAACHGRHGDVLARLQRFDEAYQELERAVALAPDTPALLAHYGELAMSTGNDRQATEAFERAIKLCPNEASYYYQAGRAHRRLKHYSRAIEQFRRAVRLRPNYGDAIRELSTLGPLAFVAQYIRHSDDAAA